MLAAAKLSLPFASTEGRAAARSAALAAFPASAVEELEALYMDEAGNLVWSYIGRFLADADAASVKNIVLAALSSSLILDGAMVHLHECGHDSDPPLPCVLTDRWKKVGGSVVKEV